jgi:hypothetical protein
MPCLCSWMRPQHNKLGRIPLQNHDNMQVRSLSAPPT